jgi:MSHA pilin protein MshA
MKQTQSGFTLIELVVVIVLLGILGVTALGKFQNLSSQAANAAIQGVASELTGASNINYASNLLNGTSTATSAGDACTSATANSLLTTPLPTGYSVSQTSACSAAGEASVCSVDATISGTAYASSAYIICTN